jgi:hypothetical protein
MSELPSQKDIELKIAEADIWVGHLDEYDELLPTNRNELLDVLANFGAKFELGEFSRHMHGQYKNAQRAIDMRMVWYDRYTEYTQWTSECAEKWEKVKGRGKG